jgi:hypothetical protein
MSPTHLTSDEIRAIVLEIACSAGTPSEKEKKFRQKYPHFAEFYPTLLDLACRPQFEMSKLQYFLQLRDQITQRERTVEDASKEVGQALFDEYVQPVVSKLPPNKQPPGSK